MQHNCVLYVNSVRKRFENLSNIISDKVEVLTIPEKLPDPSHPVNFKTNGFYVPYRLYVSGNSCGILVYVRKNFFSRCLDLLSKQSEILVTCAIFYQRHI